MRLHHPHTRDSSLRRLTLANRWLLGGSVALTGVLTEVAAQAFPGKAKASSSSSAHHAAHAKTHKAQPKTTTHKSLAPPAEAPRASESSSEPGPEAPSEPAPEATHESAPEASAPESSPSPSVESSGSSEASAPPVEESSAPAVSGGS